MHKSSIGAAILAIGLIISPLPGSVQGANAQSTQSAPEKKTKTEKTATANQVALRERQKKCAAEWKEAKKAGKIEKGMKWPQYWSACNKRLKTAG